MIESFKPQPLTKDEEQFLRDNKNSELLRVVKKAISAVAQTANYIAVLDQNLSHETMVFHKGKVAGLIAIHKYLDFTVEEPMKTSPDKREKKTPR